SAAWNYIFGRLPADEQDAARSLQEKQFVADKVLAGYQAFLKDRRLSEADKQTLKAHLEQVDDLQRRIASQTPVMQCTPPESRNIRYGEGSGTNWETAAKTFFDMMVIALKCDITR